MRARRLGIAWVLAALALTAHVADEAIHGFLALHDPAVHRIREEVPWLPLPTFTVEVWLGGLAALVLLLLLLAPLAFRSGRWGVFLAYGLGTLLVLSGLGHLAGSIVLGAPAAGVLTAPLLVVVGGYLVAAARGVAREERRASGASTS